MAIPFFPSRKISRSVLCSLLIVCFFLYTVFSYLLLFRDQRALGAISAFYPATSIWLIFVRLQLLRLGLNSLVSLGFIVITLLAFYGYTIALSQAFTVRIAVAMSLVFALIVFFSYPILSTDIFDYILSDRQAVKYQVSVWQAPPSAVIPRTDKFYNLASWQERVNPYGTINQLFYSIAGNFSGEDFLQSLLAHKLLVGIFYLGTLALIYQALKVISPEKLSRNLMLVFWNPLFVWETVGSGHNDILMIFFLIAAIVLWRKGIFLSALSLAASVLVKNIPLFLFPFLAISLLREKPLRGFVFAAVFLATILFGLVPVGVYLGNFIQRIIFASSIYWQSLPELTHLFVKNEKIFFLLASLGVYIFLALSVARGKLHPLIAFAIFLFLYLTILTSVYWNWYVVWLLVLLPFLSDSRMERPVLTLTLTSALAYPVYWLFLRFLPQSFSPPAIMYLLIAILPLSLFVYDRFFQKKSV